MISDANGVRTYTQEDLDFTSLMFSRIEEEYPEAFRALSEIYKRSMPNAPYFRWPCGVALCPLATSATMTARWTSTHRVRSASRRCSARCVASVSWMASCGAKFNNTPNCAPGGGNAPILRGSHLSGDRRDALHLARDLSRPSSVMPSARSEYTI